MKKHKLLCPALVLLLLVPLSVTAQDETTAPEQQQDQTTGLDEAEAPAQQQNEMEEAMDQEVTGAPGDLWTWRYSEVTGTYVANPSVELQGTVRDVVMTTDGEITHFVLRVSPVVQETDVQQDTAQTDMEIQDPAQQQAEEQQAGTGRRDHLVSIDQVEINETGGAEVEGQVQLTAVLNLTRDELEQSPSLQDGALPENIAQGRQLMLGGNLMKYTLMTQDGEKLGKIEDVMLNLQDKSIAYLGLGTGGVLGIGQKLFAVPLDAVTGWNTEERQIMVQANKDQLKEREGFDKNDWPSQAAGW